MPQNKIGLGKLGERLARQYLEKRGLKIKTSNYRCPYGEIDLIMEEGESLVFVEVRTRRGDDFGSPQESITSAKSVHLIQAAESYRQSLSNPNIHWRIDVVAVKLDRGGKLTRIEHIANAVTGDRQL